MMSRFTRIVIMLSVILLGLHFISFLSYEEKDNKSLNELKPIKRKIISAKKRIKKN